MLQVRLLEDIASVSPADWNALLPDANPFVRHEFLAAAESSGCASAATGWLPCHIVCEDENGRLRGAMPLYLKSHSQGEFVFDFAWANAYHQAGLRYYPKLVAAVPFTPATGPRLLTGRDAADPAQIRTVLLEAALRLAQENEASSLHVLFPQQADLEFLESQQLMLRKDCQFHWHNRDYRDFDDFLEGFTAAKRKKTRRERRKVAEAGVEYQVHTGADVDAGLWDEVMPLYRTTFLRRGREPYLDRAFFDTVTATMPENLVVIVGRQRGEAVATAICFRSDHTLYGRYWGANRFIDSLHFETCYYQGIDYCIAEGLRCFEPGTQGEHKIARGFVPTETWSAHWLTHPQFAAAVDDYLRRERDHIDRYIDATSAHVPYRSEPS